MINICLCDNDNNTLNKYLLKINNLSLVNNKNLHIETFKSGENLIFELEENPNKFNIIIIDRVMKKINGIEATKILRRYGYEGIIIFLTASKDYALESFQVEPMSYLIKNDDDNKFEEVLLKAINKIEVDIQKKLIFSNKRTKKILNIDSLLYIESMDKKNILHKVSGEQEVVTITLNYLYEKIKEYGFIRCHKSYIVNSKYIYSFDSKKCVLKNNIVIPIGRKYSKDFKSEFLKSEFDKIVL